MPSQKSKKANEAQFHLMVASLPSSTFQVMNFSGLDVVSSPYTFSIMLISSRNDIKDSEVINKQATLYIYREGDYFPYSGIISEFRFLGWNVDHANYSVTLVPKLWALNLNRQTRIFQRLKVTKIIKQVLDAAGLSDYYTLNVDETKLPELEYVVQYRESDLNFISRLMEANGIWYSFKEAPLLPEEAGDPGRESLVITNKAADFEFLDLRHDVLFRSASGLTERVAEEERESVDTLETLRQMVPREVLVKDFNYRTPEIDLTGRKPVKEGDSGAVYEYGGHFKNTGGAQDQAQLMANRFAVQKIRVDGSGNCRGFRAGKRFQLQEHFRDDFNGAYVLTKVTHQGAHTTRGGGANVSTYRNSFGCIPSAQAELFRPALKTVVPKISGIMTAKIEANGSDYAAIDEMGRYKVRMPFDLSETANFQASRYMRLSQPYAGSNYGIHFPNHEGTEMVWACLDGDPDRPLGLATVPNANTVSPVVAKNKQQGIIRTAGGNELVMDDTDAKQKVTLKTKAANELFFDDENRFLRVTTTDGNTLKMDDENECVSWNAGEHTITMTYKSGEEAIVITTKGGNVVKIDDANKKIQIQTKGGHGVEMDDNGKKITLKDGQGKNTVTLDGNGGLKLDSQGRIDITAQQDVTIKAANIKMTANAAIEAKATSDVKIKGMNIEAKADMNAKLDGGMNTEIKAGMQCNISGMMLTAEGKTKADFKGGAMATLKGGIVMIN